ncbi:tannase and feruloyl esterase-domain-containing protein [Phaeosphaeriaceae sp. PMI808]|nr:tannase and feruloyl esterase-domain-containing protein [Phaeosphaeriaceae sp. PMI808]
MFGLYTALLLLHGLPILCKEHADAVASPSLKCDSDSFQKPQIGRGVTILSIHAQPQHNFTINLGAPGQPPVNGLEFCQVQIYLTHQTQKDVKIGHNGTKDHVLVEVWLPLTLESWNGRLQATGGGGFATGLFDVYLGDAVKNGWAAVSTDGGHSAGLDKVADASWALQDEEVRKTGEPIVKRQINWNLLHNWASQSSVDQILIGKSIAGQYFGKKPHHTYWNGCSTGGRQGHAIAQKYPDLVDGILASAPAINFVNLVMSELWPQVVMNMAKTYLSNCELEYFRYHAIQSCELLEEAKTGILEDPSICHWRPSEIVGEKFECDGSEVIVTKKMAQIVQDIHDGPGGPLYSNKFPGLELGVPMTMLADITIAEDGTRSPNAFGIAAGWFRDVVFQGQSVPISELDENGLNAAWISAESEFGGLVNTHDPDLSRLRDSGTKLLTWHGINDQLIPYQNTVNYRKQVEAIMGGAHEVDEYYRLFLAPGVEHCFGGVGPFPKDPLQALIQWVEHDEPPATLEAEIISQEGDLITRNLCKWPAKAQYMGIGDLKRASTWGCSGETQEPFAPESIIKKEFDYEVMQEPQHILSDHVGDTEKRDQGEGKPGRAGQVLEGLKDRLEGLGMGIRVE